jgi:hypothetical protein
MINRNNEEKKPKPEENQKHKKDDAMKEKITSNETPVFHDKLRINIEDIEDELFDQLQGQIGESILIVTESDQLNLFGQTFRPIFCGTIISVTQGDVTLFPVNIKMINAPFFQFPTPLNIPLEKIAHFTLNFDCNERIPLS